MVTHLSAERRKKTATGKCLSRPTACKNRWFWDMARGKVAGSGCVVLPVLAAWPALLTREINLMVKFRCGRGGCLEFEFGMVDYVFYFEILCKFISFFLSLIPVGADEEFFHLITSGIKFWRHDLCHRQIDLRVWIIFLINAKPKLIRMYS